MFREGWHRRVVPVTTLVAGVVALLALLLPGVRHQVALSASHEPQEYVALSFARTDDGTVPTCVLLGRQVRVAFVATSALADPREVDYVVTVGRRELSGSIRLDPEESAVVTRFVPAPRAGRYDVEVRLPDEDRTIRAHCGGAGS